MAVATAVTATATFTGGYLRPRTMTAHAAADGPACTKEDLNADKGVEGDNWHNFRENNRDFGDFNWRDAWGKDCGDGMDNETSSARNRSGCYATLYQHVGYEGAATWVKPDARYDDGKLSNNSVGDNRASSLRLIC
ncbi:peptidase inhibitor family I36 protein [Nonomuraea sp. NPDC049400]|uniref:peptidase inhibitor family I36 protein n=1 Tax=Nonomuraea sp. NPDC049400 TaxID=3364352 RepID=UPI003796EB0D